MNLSKLVIDVSTDLVQAKVLLKEALEDQSQEKIKKAIDLLEDARELIFG